MTERTLVLVKPDGVGRKLIGEVLSRIERKGLDIVALELRTVDRELASSTTPSTTASRSSSPCWSSSRPARWSRPSSRARGRSTAFRQLAGGTDPVEKATPGTIRGDFGLETQFNLVHGSDSARVGRAGDQALVPEPLRDGQRVRQTAAAAAAHAGWR